MPPISVQSKENSGDGGSATIAATFDANVIASNFIFVAVAWEDTGPGILSVADTPGNTYTLLNHNFHGTSSQALDTYYADDITGGACTVTVTFNASQSFRRIIIAEYSGVQVTPDPLDQKSETAATTTTAGADATVGSSVTTTADGDLVVGAIHSDTTIAVGSGWTEEDNIGAGTATLQVEYLIQATANTISPTWTAGAGGVWMLGQTSSFFAAPEPETGAALAWITA